MKKNTKKLLGFFKLFPQYTETSLFLFSISFLLMLFDGIFREAILTFFTDEDLLVFVLGVFLAIFVSIKYALDEKKTPTKEAKALMIFFAMCIEFVTAISFIMSYFSESTQSSIILGIITLVHVILTMILFRFGVINENNITSHNADHLELIIGSIVIVAIFIFSKFYFEHTTELTFALLMSYSLLINSLLQPIFKKNN